MKKNEIIELNGQEYTLELNRDSFIQIDQLCNIEKTFKLLDRDFYQYYDEEELPDDFDLENLKLNEESLEKELEEREKILHRAIERSFLIWLYPNHKLTISQVKEILKPYLEDEEKAKWIGEHWGKYINECIDIRESYNEQQKNLKALANKKN